VATTLARPAALRYVTLSPSRTGVPVASSTKRTPSGVTRVMTSVALTAAGRRA